MIGYVFRGGTAPHTDLPGANGALSAPGNLFFLPPGANSPLSAPGPRHALPQPPSCPTPASVMPGTDRASPFPPVSRDAGPGPSARVFAICLIRSKFQNEPHPKGRGSFWKMLIDKQLRKAESYPKSGLQKGSPDTRNSTCLCDRYPKTRDTPVSRMMGHQRRFPRFSLPVSCFWGHRRHSLSEKEMSTGTAVFGKETSFSSIPSR